MARWGLRRLTVCALQRLAADFRAVVTQHLRNLACRLEEGYSVYFAPEGGVSLDGRFGRVRAGIRRLGHMLPASPAILPMSLTYDSLGPGRTRAIVRVGAVLRDMEVEDSRALARELRRVLTTRLVVTPSHFLALFLCGRAEPFSASELVRWLDHAQAASRAAGLETDPVFEELATDVLVRQRLHWLRRKRLVRPCDGLWHNQYLADAAQPRPRAARSVRCLANALADLAPELAGTLTP